MLALTGDVFLILLIGVTTGVTVSLHDERIRSKFFISIVTISNYLIEMNKTQIQQVVLSFASFIDAIKQLVTGQQKSTEAKREGSVVTIPLKFMGKDYTLPVSYDSSIAREMRSYYTVKDGVRTPLNQPPGIPLLVTPKDLGVDSINYDDVNEEESF
jgi:hypothetical protein